MATSYKTPGVYIEEIPKFPPSVAEVETAIPVFVGHTRQADRVIPDDLQKNLSIFLLSWNMKHTMGMRITRI